MVKKSLIAAVLLSSGTAFAQSEAPVVAAAKQHSSLACEPAKVHIGGSAQFRYGWNTNTNNIGDNNTNGFSVPLARIHMTGNVNSDIDFKIEGEFDSNNDNFALTDAYAGISAFDNGRFQLGQFRLPFLYEQNVDAEFQMAAQTSAFSNIFGQGYSQGLMFEYEGKEVKAQVAVSDGFNTADTNFDDAAESDLALTARVNFVPFGAMHNFDEFTAYSGDSKALMLGAAVHYQDENIDTDSLFTYTLDANMKMGGLGLYAAGVGRAVDTASESFDDFGGIAQASYRISNFEPFARYEIILPDDARNLSNDAYSFLTGGVNYYLYEQAAKITVDAVYAFEATNDLTSLNAFSTNSLLPSSDDGEISLVAQFQVLF